MATTVSIAFGPDEQRGLLEEYRGLKSEYTHEIQRAIDRIGRDSVMKWLIDFTKKDLMELSIGDLSNLRYEIVFLSEYLISLEFLGDTLTAGIEISLGDFIDKKCDDEFKLAPEKIRKRTTVEAPVVGQWGLLNEQPKSFSSLREMWDFIKMPSFKVISDLQNVTQKHLDEFVDGGSTIFLISDPGSKAPKEFSGFGLSALKIDVGKETLGHFNLTTVSPLQLWGYLLIPRLAGHAHQLRRCSSCNNIFLAIRKTQKFCSPNCQWRTSAAKHRATPPDRIGKRGRPPGTGKKQAKEKEGVSHGKKR